MSAELAALLNQQVSDQARDSLLAFAIYNRNHYDPNWHHRRLCEKLDLFAQGKIKRLMVFMPPRHGKSELVSRCLPAYLLGREPDASIIATSYSAGLASRMNRDVQRIIDSEAYSSVFPETALSSKNIRTVAQGKWLRNASIFEVVGRRGSYRCAGIGGGITGMGADFGIIDDPIKSQEDAYSVVYRDRVWDWYISTFYTRLEGEDACILVTLTRWHEDDLAGRLIQRAEEDPNADQWDVLSLPAVCEPNAHEVDHREVGEALWPSKFPLSILEKNKANGSYFWNALFQQRPAPEEGGILKRDWLKYYHDLPEGVTDWLMSWDMTFKETRKGSFVCCQVWCRKGARFYLVDQHRERLDFPGTIKVFKKMVDKYPQCGKILVEEKANGPAVISSLKLEIPGIIAINPRGSKEARLHGVSPMVEAGNVYLPSERWVDDLVEELASFPNSAFNDQVDTLSQALDRYKGKRTGKLVLNLDVGLKREPEPWR